MVRVQHGMPPESGAKTKGCVSPDSAQVSPSHQKPCRQASRTVSLGAGGSLVQPSQGPRVRVRARVNCASSRKLLRPGCCTLTELRNLYMFGEVADDPGTLISQRPRTGPAPHCALHDGRLRYITGAATLDRRRCHPSYTDVCRRRGCDSGDRGGVQPNVSTPRR